MNTANSFIIRLNNSKGNPPHLSKKDKINNLKTNIIINNTAKTRENNNLNFLNNKNNPRRGNKHRERFYNKKNNNINKKVRIAKLDKYYKEKKKFKF